MFPDYGSPGSPNLDPYYVSPQQQQADDEAAAAEVQNLRDQVASAILDGRGHLDADTVRRIVGEEAEKLLRV